MHQSNRVKDLTNMRFGCLVVLNFSTLNHGNKSVWECQCDCGKKTKVVGTILTQGKTKSCGCLCVNNQYNKGNPEYVSAKKIVEKVKTEGGYISSEATREQLEKLQLQIENMLTPV